MKRVYSLTIHILVWCVRAYRYYFFYGAMWFAPWSACRFFPTCSAYTEEAFLRFGMRKGLILAIRRLVRCRPKSGFGYDPLPYFNPKPE